jgi:hypothetical protein
MMPRVIGKCFSSPVTSRRFSVVGTGGSFGAAARSYR